MSTWTKIQKLRGIRKSLVQKEEIIDKNMNIFIHQATFAWIGWQAKIYFQDYMAGYKKL